MEPKGIKEPCVCTWDIKRVWLKQWMESPNNQGLSLADETRAHCWDLSGVTDERNNNWETGESLDRTGSASRVVFRWNDTCSAPRPCVQRKREMEWEEPLWINWHVALYSEKLSDGRLSSVNERFTSLTLHGSFWPPSAGFVARASDGV